MNGEYAIYVGTSSCLPCWPSSWQPFSGQGYCQSSDPGYYTPNYNMTSEIACPAGTYMPWYGSSQCQPCPSGQYGCVSITVWLHVPCSARLVAIETCNAPSCCVGLMQVRSGTVTVYGHMHRCHRLRLSKWRDVDVGCAVLAW